jgi:putative tricarboxylic transport membrane protein
MSHANQTGGAGPSHRNVEIGFTLFLGLLGAIAVYGALQVGIGWGAEGPKAGFFPFYVGAAVVLGTIVNLMHALRENEKPRFAEWSQIRQVISVVIPTAIYVAVIPFLGIYVSSAILIAGFMKYFGRYSWLFTFAVAILTPLAIFVMFEMWFLVPLPKGPVETYLGY